MMVLMIIPLWYQGWTIIEKQFPQEDDGVEVWQENNVKICLGEGR